MDEKSALAAVEEGIQPVGREDLPLVTLDNNALIAAREEEPDAPAVRALLDLNRAGAINITITASTSMEAQRSSDRVERPDQIACLESHCIARDNIFTSGRSIGFSVPDYPGVPFFDPLLEIQFCQRIHAIFHPEIPFMWGEYRDRECAKLHLSDVEMQALGELDRVQSGLIRTPPWPTPALETLSSEKQGESHRFLQKLRRRWFNAKNDTQGFYTHLTLAWHTGHPEHAVFVTSDKRLFAKDRIAALRALGYPGQVLPPAEAVAFLLATKLSILPS